MTEKEYQATVKITYEESFDLPAESPERAKEKAIRWVSEDMGHGEIPVEAFEIEGEVEEITL